MSGIVYVIKEETFNDLFLEKFLSGEAVEYISGVNSNWVMALKLISLHRDAIMTLNYGRSYYCRLYKI